MIYFEGASGVLVLAPTIETNEAPTPASTLSVRRKLIIHGSSDDVYDALFSPMLAGAKKVVPPCPKPCFDEGPSMAAASLDEPEVSSMDFELVPMDVPMTTSMIKKDVTIIKAKATIIVAQACLEATQHRKEELELNLANLTKKWDSHIVKLQAKTKRLSVIRSQATPIDPRILKEKAHKRCS
ncbi:uncharacterized protein A4U43_C07F22550 [Asparagus officinalis]|uniref:Uncharacterized protein n=1 Tax=Asparagus officinalis TaxID=4686 RepID=A0A5P1EE83_ASPOF|nr:uncharacterized protein A4U43_C07F22550 [Asparagus officinalis]